MKLQQYWPTDDSKCLKTTCVGIFLFLLVFSFSIAVSASPSEIYIQGVVRNSTTLNLTTGLRDVNITFFNGSTPIYSQVQSSQAIDNGVYHTTFTTIMHDWFLWPLEFVIKVGNDEFTQTEIVPVPISHAAYVANNSYYLAGHLAAEFVTDSASASWDRSAADDYNEGNLTAQTSGWDKNSADDYATSNFNIDLANSGIRTSIVNNITSVNDSMRPYVISTNASMKSYVDANSLSLVTLDNGSIIRNINQSWVLAQLGGNWMLANASAWYNSNGYKKANLTLDYPNLDTDSTNDLSLATLDNGSVIRNINQSWVLAQLGGNWILANATAWYNSNGYKKANLTLDYPNLDTDSTNDLSLATLDNGSVIRNINQSWVLAQFGGNWLLANQTTWYTNNGYTIVNFTANLISTGLQASIQNFTNYNCSAGEYVFGRHQNGSWYCRADQTEAGAGGYWMAENTSLWYNANGYKKANLTRDYPDLDTDSTNDLSLATLDNGSIIRNINISWWYALYNLAGYYGLSNFTTDISNSGIRTSITNNITSVNNSMRPYVISTNASMKTYVDARDIIINDSMSPYVISTNASMKTYVDAADQIINNTLNPYVISTNASMATRVDYLDAFNLKNASDAKLNRLNVTVEFNVGPFRIIWNATTGQAEMGVI